MIKVTLILVVLCACLCSCSFHTEIGWQGKSAIDNRHFTPGKKVTDQTKY